MKWLIIGLVFFSAGFALYLNKQGELSQTGMAPGLKNGKLAECPVSPNCISTEYPDDASHYLAPLVLTKLTGIGIDAITRSADIIASMGGVVTLQTANYLSATFTSKIFHFVDDVEIRLDKDTGTVHLRSASRVGYSDINANKERAEIFYRLWRE